MIDIICNLLKLSILINIDVKKNITDVLLLAKYISFVVRYNSSVQRVYPI
ncbi:hypothetical protein NAI66_05325 [Francisella tularensis subsp. holarctica]|nr:hypothetical protein [Francisella tularensis]ABI83425.1 hypothetical protein FTH_1648 [Francisella tularensis subsp. holarctica OSU18]ABU62286.1 hypothetical protein FTA_1811 [Francisella tularensis subsp. holarctica FTNF002-00]ADA79291.1 hypothetical protein NE061598_09230 [Francisella tularensis subsp. tularensis NE061598]APA82321.1 hypothetical protein N894_0337 [Francisella tularensis subsp. novicida PA10-7858]EDX19055.1 hypothetical protein FTE_1345 [Francisella tularensis subsp. novic